MNVSPFKVSERSFKNGFKAFDPIIQKQFGLPWNSRPRLFFGRELLSGLLIILISSLSFAQTGSVYITSIPQGADISLDENPIQQKTDLLLESIPTGDHKITVRHRDHGKTEKRVEVVEDLTATVHFDLRPREAKQAVEKKAGKESKDANHYHSLGFSHLAKNEYELAIAAFTKALEVDPRLMVGYYNRGVAYFELGRSGLAVADFTRAMELGLKGKGAYRIRGLSYAREESYDLAIADFSKVLDLDPKDAATYGIRGIMNILKGEYQQTVSDFTRAIELDSENVASYHLHLGFVLDRMGEKEKARHHFFRARELDREIIRKSAELLERHRGTGNERFYAEEILSASQYIGVQSQLLMKAKESIEQKASLPVSASRLPPSRQGFLTRISSKGFILTILSLLVVVALILVFVIRSSGGRRKKASEGRNHSS